jgi:hypothetical protein
MSLGSPASRVSVGAPETMQNSSCKRLYDALSAVQRERQSRCSLSAQNVATFHYFCQVTSVCVSTQVVQIADYGRGPQFEALQCLLCGSHMCS